MLVTLYSKVFLEDDDSWSARPSATLLQRLHNGEGSARWIASIGDSYISIGDPAPGNGFLLYLPVWFMDSLGLESGVDVDIDFKRSEDFPKATSLTFRMMGSSHNIDIRDLLEEPLSQLGVLQVGQIIPVPALEGVLVLESCEPDGVVFLDGAEIALDIEESESPEAEAPQAEAPQAEAPESPQVEASEDFEAPMIAPIVPVSFETPVSKKKFPPKYIPFQGTGYKLG